MSTYGGVDSKVAILVIFLVFMMLGGGILWYMEEDADGKDADVCDTGFILKDGKCIPVVVTPATSTTSDVVTPAVNCTATQVNKNGACVELSTMFNRVSPGSLNGDSIPPGVFSSTDENTCLSSCYNNNNCRAYGWNNTDKKYILYTTSNTIAVQQALSEHPWIVGEKYSSL